MERVQTTVLPLQAETHTAEGEPQNYPLRSPTFMPKDPDLPEMATEALVRGIDSPSLRLLAGQPRNDVRYSADLFLAALDELGIEVLEPDRAQ